MDNEVNEEITILKPHEPIVRSSLQHQTPTIPFEMVPSSSETRSVRMQEKGSLLKSGKPASSGKTDDTNSVNHHRPWPSRKANEVKEVVKNMSRVPSYLQRMENGVSVQEKALNIGVLDWQSLEKWTHLQKQDANSTSSSQSSRRNGIPHVQRKQASSTGGRRINMMKETSVHEKINSGDTEPTVIYHKKSQSADYEASVKKKCISFDLATANSGIVSGVTDDSNSGIFSRDNLQLSSPSLPPKGRIDEPGVPSCESVQVETKIATAPRRDLSPHRLLTSGLGRLRGSSARDNRRSYSGPLPSASHSNSVSSILQSANEEKASTGPPRRELSPHRLLTAGLNRLRSNSVRDSSPRRQTVYSTEDNAAGTSKGRRSPLRRMFDPLLKSKNRSIQFSGPVVSLASHQSTNEVSNSERLPIREELQSAKGQVSEPRCSVQDEFCAMSTRQAVLKLAWKNGLPLFMFSCDNNDILAATIGKRNASEKKNFECFYTIFTAHEVKKKGGAWMNQGNSKSKKHGLVYNVVGHIRISLPERASYGSRGYSEMRECVLFGSEMVPASEKPVASLSNCELAAVLILSSSTESLQSEQTHESSALSKVVAVLPKGVHGLSSEREPSPLIERWKSRGSCDCGGWDEGCILTVLTECRGSTPAQDCKADGTHRTKLFTKASEARANRHAFSMDTFEEGVYTVDFRASVASMQAFAICVAILHCRKSTNLSTLKYSVEAQNLQEDTFPDYADTDTVPTKTDEEDPAGYVPDPPPPSPVGRA